MEYLSENNLTDAQLSFIGKTLSIFTHEVKNHLAIIKESIGLIGDMIEMGKTSSSQDTQQSLKIIQSIENQIGKTSWFCNNLNRFGHRMDNPLSTFNANESLEELLVLLHRLANQKRLSIEKDFTQDIPPIYNNPSKLQFLVFCFIEKNIRRLDKDSRIIIKTKQSNSSVELSIIPEGNFIGTDEKGICSDEIHQHVIKQLRGSITREKEGVTITLPVSIA